MTRAEIKAAIAKGHTHAIAFDQLKGGRKIISTHKTYEEARRKLTGGKSKGNMIYALEDMLRSTK